jgi:uncharacterized repeat protein (TIGR01451 family)
MKKRMSWYWALPVALGLALVMVAITSWGSGPAAHAQAPTATPNPACQLHVNKTADESTVPEDGTATFTIEVTNDGNGDCVDPTISDVVPDQTDCSDASVASSSDVTDIDISGCKKSGTVKWESNDNFGKNDTVVLTLVLALESGASKGDKITNEACATSSSDVGGECDNASIKVGAPETATPTTAATTAALPTVAVPTIAAPPPVAPPVVVVAPTIAPPATGTGSDDSSRPLAATLALVGAVLLLGSGAVLVKRTR